MARLKVGMLWFDNRPDRALEDKLGAAVSYFEDKYGVTPDTCLIHPSTAAGAPDMVAGLSLQESNAVLPHHFWVGVAGAKVMPVKEA